MDKKQPRPQNIQFRNRWLLERFEERRLSEPASEIAQRDLVRYYTLLNLVVRSVSLSPLEFDALCRITDCQPFIFCNSPDFYSATEGGVARVHADLVAKLLYYQSRLAASTEKKPSLRQKIAGQLNLQGVDLAALIKKVEDWSFLEAFAVCELIEHRPYLDDEQLKELLQQWQLNDEQSQNDSE